MIGYHTVDTAWGFFGYVAGADGLVGTHFPTKTRDGAVAHLCRAWSDASPGLHRLPQFERQVVAYFDRKPVRFAVDLELDHLPPFHQRVLQACAVIPYGTTVSYGDLARRAGNGRAGRAVGNCMNRNPMPLVIPCHRVIRSNGALGGFGAASGESLKRKLLDWEGAL